MNDASTVCPAVACLLALGVSTTCSAGSGRHDRDGTKYRELGHAAAFECVGEVTRPPTPGSSWRPSGSAVLIAPRWALTAGHVAAAGNWQEHGYRFGGKQYRAVRRVVHPSPEVREGVHPRLAGMVAGADLGLVQLDQAVQDVEPATRYRGDKEVGRTMTKVGFGCIGDGLAGMASPARQERRAGHNVVDAAGGNLGDLVVSDRVLLCDFDHPNDPSLNRFGDPAPLDLEIGLSVGDSGGGWFIREGDSWTLIAITSGHFPSTGNPRDYRGPDSYGTVIAGMRIATANEWIDGIVHAEAAEE